MSEFKAKLKAIKRNISEDCFEITLQTNNPIESILKWQEQDLRLKLTKWSEHHSLDANNYCWALFTLLAEKLDSSKDEVYEEELQKYGYFDDPPIPITVSANVDMDKIDGHWKFYRESCDGKFKSYIRIRGISEYGSREMAHFIDMVIEDCKEQDIETLPPDEFERLKSAWGKDNK